MRISTLPTAFGEKMVMRIFDPTPRSKIWMRWFFAARPQRWGAREASARHHFVTADRLGQDHHAVFHAQAPGHGRGEREHVEDPIEMIEIAFNQTQVATATGLWFYRRLRA